MSEHYIRNHFQDIKTYANIMEKRMDDDWCTMEHGFMGMQLMPWAVREL